MEPRFEESMRSRSAKIAIVGLGYVGVPLALAYAQTGFTVIGLDVSADRVRRLCAGESYLLDIPGEAVREQVSAGRFRPTVNASTLREADVIFICVPTPLDKTKAPDLGNVIAAAERVGATLRPGQLVLLESTTYPGTTREVVLPILERSGLRAGIDFFLGFSPERIDPGNRQFTLDNTAKVVAGIDAESTDRAAFALEQIVRHAEVHRVSSPEAAELAKLLENTFRAVNVAMINELAMLCDRMGTDVWEVIDAAKTKPYGFMPFYPGPGVGGHCIPIDPYYLLWKAREFDFSTKFIEVATAINLEMPFFTVEKLRRILREHGKSIVGARILALGAAFKRDTDDARNSSAIRVIEILRNEGADVRYHDPHVPTISVGSRIHGEHPGDTELRSVGLSEQELRAAACVIVLVGHRALDLAKVVKEAPLIFDTVNATKGHVSGAATIVRL